jgi:hypothetical protein
MTTRSLLFDLGDMSHVETVYIVLEEEKNENPPYSEEQLQSATLGQLLVICEDAGIKCDRQQSKEKILLEIRSALAKGAWETFLPFGLVVFLEGLPRQDESLVSEFDLPRDISTEDFLLWKEDVMVFSANMCKIVLQAQDLMFDVPSMLSPSNEEEAKTCFSRLSSAIRRGELRSRMDVFSAIDQWSNLDLRHAANRFVTTLLKVHHDTFMKLEKCIRDPPFGRVQRLEGLNRVLRQFVYLDFGREEQTAAVRFSIGKSLNQLVKSLGDQGSIVSDRNQTAPPSPEKEAAVPPEPFSADVDGPIQFPVLIEELGGSVELNPVDKPGVIEVRPFESVSSLQPTNLSNRLGPDDAAEADASSGNDRPAPAMDVDDAAAVSDEGPASDNSDRLVDDDEEEEKEEEEEEEYISSSKNKKKRPSAKKKAHKKRDRSTRGGSGEEDDVGRLQESERAKRLQTRQGESQGEAQAQVSAPVQDQHVDDEVVSSVGREDEADAIDSSDKADEANKKRDRSTRGGGSGDDDDVGRLKDSERAKRSQTRQGESQARDLAPVQDQHVDDEVVSSVGREDEAEAVDSSDKAEDPNNKRDRPAPDVVPAMVASAPPAFDGRALVVEELEKGPSLSLALVEGGGASKKQKKQKSGLSLEEVFVPLLEKMKLSADANVASLANEKEPLTIKMPLLEKQDGAELVNDHTKLATVYNSAAGGKRSAKETLAFLVVWWALCERALMIADIFEHLSTIWSNVKAGWKDLPEVIGRKKKLKYNYACSYRSLGMLIRKYPRLLFQTESINITDWQVTYLMGDENQNTVRVLEQILAEDAEERSYWSSAPAVGVVASALTPSSN